METFPAELKQFHGGITDNFVDTAANKYERADNLLVTINQKLYTRFGSVIWDADNPQVPIGQQRIGSIRLFQDVKLIHSGDKVYYVDSGWQTLQGPGSNDVFINGGVDYYPSWGEWNNHLFTLDDNFSPLMKIYKDDVGDLQVRNAGLPELASEPNLAGTVGTNAYLYAFVYFYTYTVDTVVFEDFGAVTQVAIDTIDAPDSNVINITSIPVLAGGNYDTANIKIKIYRTQNNGTTFTYLGEVTNGTTIYNDTASDSSIINNTALYTTGGVLENDAPPSAKYFHVALGRGWYGNIKTSDGELIANRLQHSKKDDIDSCPATNFYDLEGDITAINSFSDRVLYFERTATYRIDGSYDDLGDGVITDQKISDTIGCISNQSVVQIPTGVVFASEEGFCFTNGYDVFKISNEFNETYKALVESVAQGKKIQGDYDKINNRIWWTVKGSGASDNDQCFIFDMRWGIKPDSCFTTVSGGEHFAPTAIMFDGDDMYRGDRRGYIFKHNAEYESDPYVDTSKSVADWDTAAIIWDFMSMSSSLGTTMLRKWVTWINIYVANQTNISVQINSINDVDRKIVALTPLRFRKNKVWGDLLDIWHTGDDIWNYSGVIEEKRRFTAGSLRCSYKQIQITNAYVNVIGSDSIVDATVDSAAKTVTLDDTVTYAWPDDILEYYITFSNDSYDKEYLITARTADTLTLADANDTLVDGSQSWLIKGKPKNEILNLLGFTLGYKPIGETQATFNADSVGNNA